MEWERVVTWKLEQLAVHFEKTWTCLYRTDVATIVATLRTRVLLPLGSQWQGEQMSKIGWDLFHTFFGCPYPREVCGGSFAGPTGDGNSDFHVASSMKDSSSYKIEETSTKRILFKEHGDYRERFRWKLGNSHVIGSRSASWGNGLRMVAAAARPPILGFKLPSAVG